MMGKMREKIAQTIYERRNGHGCAPWSRLPQSHKAPYLGDADAALDALSEPTEAMISHGEALADFIMPEGFDNSLEGRRAEFRGAFISALSKAKERKDAAAPTPPAAEEV